MKLEKKLIDSYKSNDKTMNKKDRLFTSPDSGFIKIMCGSCQHIRITFNHAKRDISCTECDTLLGRPTGGKLKINSEAKVLPA
eukprot:GAHX01000007.1.p1 GENE.GAHX01000007.1~~GAHX01000007.1.p1  ORF type:complete len:83 (+),score=17.82 GAHX01000007.1:50-298(+)